MSEIFIRGGQLSLHSLRMIQQVLVVLLKWGAIIFLISMVYFCYQKITVTQLESVYVYYLSEFFVELHSPEHLIRIHNIPGANGVLSAIQIYKNQIIIKHVDVCLMILKTAAINSALICIGILVLIFLIFLKKGSSFSKDISIRGGQLVSKKELLTLLNKLTGRNPYKIAGIPYPKDAEMMHTLIAGSTGSGKTILISDLIAQIKARGDKAIVFDKMGNYLEQFYDETTDILLNPFDKRSKSWNLFNEVKMDAAFDSIAAAFIPNTKGTNDPFWVNAARTVFVETCLAMKRNGNLCNKSLVKYLLMQDLTSISTLLKGTAAQSIIDEQSPKTALSVIAMLTTYLKSLKYLSDEGEMFSIKEWVHDDSKRGTIFITSSGDLHVALTPLISAWLEIAINNLLSKNKSGTKIWIILDELPSLHTLPSLEQGLAEVRQFGGCFVLSIQSIAQLRDRYGHNGSQTIGSLCNNKIYLRAGDIDSARWYSDNIGTVEIEEFKEGLSYGAHQMRDGVNLNKQRQNKALVLPSEIMNLAEKEGYFAFAKFPITKTAFEYVARDKKNTCLQLRENTEMELNTTPIPLSEEEEKAGLEKAHSIESEELLYE